MRILMLAQFYPPVVGGEEHHVRDLSVELAARDHTVSVATLSYPGKPRFAIEQGVRVHRISGLTQKILGFYTDSTRRHVPPLPDPGLVWALREVIGQEKPEIVHAHNWMVHSFLPLKAWSKAKLVMSLHDHSLVCAVKTLVWDNGRCPGTGLGCIMHSAEHYGPVKGIPTALANWVMSGFERASVDMFLGVSKAVLAGNHLLGSDLPYAVIPNFVRRPEPPTGDWGEYLARLPDTPFFLFVGDLREFKGIGVLLRAYRSLLADGGGNAPPLVLIGRILEETPRDFPPNTFVLNKWPHEAVMAALPRSLAVLMPSIGPEPFGIAALEAAMSGRPVIASDIGGLPEVIDAGETGLLVPPGDPGALCAAMSRMVDESSLSEQLGRNAKVRAERFYAENVVPRIEAVYEQLLLKSPRGELARPPLPMNRAGSRGA